MHFKDLNKFDKNIFNRLFAYYDNNINPKLINVLENKEYNKDNRLTIYQTPFNSIIFASSYTYKVIKEKIKQNIGKRKIYLDDLKSLLDYNNYNDEDNTLCLFLNPENKISINPPRDLKMKTLTEDHKKSFIEFKKETASADLEEGQVSIEDPVVVGCFDKDKLVSVASYWFWGDGLADIGIVTHPDYRQKGIGKALISNLCDYGFELDRINVYRHNEKNLASRNLALSLNFEQKLIIETTKILRE